MVRTIIFLPVNKYKISFLEKERRLFKRWKPRSSLLLLSVRWADFSDGHLPEQTVCTSWQSPPWPPGTGWQDCARLCPGGSPSCTELGYTKAEEASVNRRISQPLLNSGLLTSFLTPSSAFLQLAKMRTSEFIFRKGRSTENALLRLHPQPSPHPHNSPPAGFPPFKVCHLTLFFSPVPKHHSSRDTKVEF